MGLSASGMCVFLVSGVRVCPLRGFVFSISPLRGCGFVCFGGGGFVRFGAYSKVTGIENTVVMRRDGHIYS